MSEAEKVSAAAREKAPRAAKSKAATAAKPKAETAAKPKAARAVKPQDTQGEKPEDARAEMPVRTGAEKPDEPASEKPQEPEGEEADEPEAEKPEEPDADATKVQEAAGDKELTWTSGDWIAENRAWAPYNGIKITASPSYTGEILSSLELAVSDYSYSPGGSSRTVVFKPAIPMKLVRLQPSMQEGMTISGTLQLIPSYELDAVILFVDLRYGAQYQEHNVEGGVLKISSKVQ